MKEMQEQYTEFETGKLLATPKQVEVPFQYISQYFLTAKWNQEIVKENRYVSKKLTYKKDPHGGLGTFKTVTVIGASGAMGSEILKRILMDHLLPDCKKIQIFGRTNSISQRKGKNFYYALIEKLKDGRAGLLPPVEFIDSYDKVDGELLIMCAGKTLPKDASIAEDRPSLQHKNAAVFKHCAGSIERNSFPSPKLILVVSNPNELCTWIFSKYFKRVVAIGHIVDSLRFQREIRDELVLPPEQSVEGLVGGNHELEGMILYKSLLRINGKRPSDHLMERIFSPAKGHEDIGAIYKRAYEMVQNGEEGVFKYINIHSVLTRVAIKPLIEYFCGGRADFPVGVATTSIIKAFQGEVRTLVTLTKRVLIKEDEICVGIPLFISKAGIEEIELDSIEKFKEYGDNEKLLKAAEIFKKRYLAFC